MKKLEVEEDPLLSSDKIEDSQEKVLTIDIESKKMQENIKSVKSISLNKPDSSTIVYNNSNENILKEVDNHVLERSYSQLNNKSEDEKLSEKSAQENEKENDKEDGQEDDQENDQENDKENYQENYQESVQESDQENDQEDDQENDQEDDEENDQENELIVIDQDKFIGVENSLINLDEKLKTFHENYRNVISNANLEILSEKSDKDLQLDAKEHAALYIQKNFKGWILRSKYKKLKRSILKIQKW